MSRASLKRDFFWNTVGVLAQNAISPILLIVVTRINGIYDSGIFSFAFSVSVIFLALGMWGGRTFQISDTKSQFSSLNYLTVRILLSVVMLIGAVIFCLINNYDPFKSSVIIGLVVVKIFEAISDALYGTMQVGGKLYISGRSLLLKAVLGFTLFVIIDTVTKNIFLATIGLIASNAIIILIYDVPRILASDRNAFSAKGRKAKSLLDESVRAMRVSSPVFIITFMAMFSLNIPRYFVDMYHPSEIGYFGILAMPITLVTLAVSFLLQPKMVDLADAYNRKKDKIFKKDVRVILLIATFLSLIIIITTYLIGVPLLGAIFGLDFSAYKLELMIIVVGATLNAYVAIFMNIIIIARKFRTPLIIIILSTFLFVFLSMYMVLHHSLLGGVVSYATINLVQLILFGIFCYKLIGKLHENA